MEEEQTSAREAFELFNKHAKKNIEDLQTQVEALEALVPDEGDRLNLERKAQQEVEVEWKEKLKDISQDLEAARTTVQNLMHQNLALKVTLKNVQASKEAEEAEYCQKHDILVHTFNISYSVDSKI